LETFVREILQNSTDARDEDTEPVEVSFRLREFEDRSEFDSAILWNDLYKHVKAGGDDQDGHGLSDYVDYLENGGRFGPLSSKSKTLRESKGTRKTKTPTTQP